MGYSQIGLTARVIPAGLPMTSSQSKSLSLRQWAAGFPATKQRSVSKLWDGSWEFLGHPRVNPLLFDHRAGRAGKLQGRHSSHVVGWEIRDLVEAVGVFVVWCGGRDCTCGWWCGRAGWQCRQSRAKKSHDGHRDIDITCTRGGAGPRGRWRASREDHLPIGVAATAIGVGEHEQ